MGGRQLVESAADHTAQARIERYPEPVLKANTIKAINKAGVTEQQKKYDDRLFAHSEELRQKKMSSDSYVRLDLDEFLQQARNTQLDNDRRYRNKPHLDNLAKVSALMKTTYWTKLTVTGGFYDELKRVFPVFYKLLKKEKKGKKLVKGEITSGKGTYKTSLLLFCKLVVDISKGKEKNILSSKSRLKVLKRAKVDQDLI